MRAEEEIYTMDDLSALLGITKATVIKHCKNAGLEFQKHHFGPRVYRYAITMPQLQTLLDEMTEIIPVCKNADCVFRYLGHCMILTQSLHSKWRS